MCRFQLITYLLVWPLLLALQAVHAEVRIAAMNKPLRSTTWAHVDGDNASLPEGALLRLKTVPPEGAPKGAPSIFACVAYSPDGKMLATCGFNSPLRLWDALTGKEIRRLGDQDDSIGRVAFSPEGTVLASSGRDQLPRVLLWDSATGKNVGELRGNPEEALVLAFSPDGKCLAAAGREKVSRIWDVSTRKQVGTK